MAVNGTSNGGVITAAFKLVTQELKSVREASDAHSKSIEEKITRVDDKLNKIILDFNVYRERTNARSGLWGAIAAIPTAISIVFILMRLGVLRATAH